MVPRAHSHRDQAHRPRRLTRITAAISSKFGERPIKELLDSYNPTGSTKNVNLTTSMSGLWTTDPRRSQVNQVVLHSATARAFPRPESGRIAVKGINHLGD